MLKYNFEPGKIVYNEFNIDFSLPFSKQIDCLNEDLMQVSYNENYILDIGWYPESNPSGSFIIQLIKNYCWDNPIFKEKCKSENDLVDNIIKAINTIR
ncbi:MAG: hypothetical protein K2H13_04520 [Eubacterium sp.]|nr:hypothetical protein [Eubacterium sp.]